MGDDKSEKRPALGEITNQLGKRGFSLISRSPASKSSRSENTQTGDDTDTDSSFWKQVSLVVEKLEKERSVPPPAKCPKIVNEVGLSPLKGGKTYRLLNTSAGSSRKGVSNVGNDSKEPCSSALDSIDLDSNNVVVDVGDAVKEGCDSGPKAGESSKGEARVVSGCGNVGVDSGATSRPEVVVSSKMSKIGEMRGFGLERCTAFREDGGCSVAAGVDLVKNCSCSFCTKAAYIWSDLHYQDVKGRRSVIEKSQKEASNLVKKYSAENEIGRHGQGNSTDVSQLDTDLMGHWRSLFLHMEDIFVTETNQLQNSFNVLKDLREDCKTNLEMISGTSDVQQCSSDASDHTIG